MKARELAILLRKTANILDFYEDSEVSEVLDQILLLVKQNSKATKKNINKEQKVQRQDVEESIDIHGIISTLHRMDSKELEDYLNKEKIFQSRESLLRLAKEMSIVSSNRQTIAALKHSIIKYFERQKLDHIIRVDRNE
ncbi:hypothetical protein [Bacillus toyonensis]|uniref:hypothetical protein n=1 Tax=Bacillus toyonensis TaxID=155322 RepID=UPI000BF0F4E1|nr:hypothetical protein [Bacillus toyonensis]PEM44307.1 hypothetical protein CN636_13010 [Bacillus toyonensis]